MQKSFIHQGKVAHYINSILIVGGTNMGSFESVEEAKQYLDVKQIEDQIKEDKKSSTKETDTNSVVMALKETGISKPTESLVENYKFLLENKKFFPSNNLVSLRNRFDDPFIGDKIDYVLEDGTIVLLSKTTNQRINTLIESKFTEEFVMFMTANKSNFYRCVTELLSKEE